ncbi:MAG: hypothetical protein EB015_07335 [Methylocystaceae bacterium]|nr:hypothetical protein [Methylocystaceae bacterium]
MFSLIGIFVVELRLRLNDFKTCADEEFTSSIFAPIEILKALCALSVDFHFNLIRQARHFHLDLTHVLSRILAVSAGSDGVIDKHGVIERYSTLGVTRSAYDTRISHWAGLSRNAYERANTFLLIYTIAASSDQVVFKLFTIINERVNYKSQTRIKILSLYAECVTKVKDPF